MTRDIAAVMIAVDRSPRENFLAGTLANLKRSDLLTSDRLMELAIVTPDRVWAKGVMDGAGLGRSSYLHGGTHPANANAAQALRRGAATGADWVLFLEDDIDVIGRFFDSVGAWLDINAADDVVIYPLGANYAQTQGTKVEGWRYPTHKFYGTQAVAFRSSICEPLADRIERWAAGDLDGETHSHGYDIAMARWHRVHHGPTMLTPVPSFVQHTGTTSVIAPTRRPHTFPSWPGREWDYLSISRKARQARRATA
jgi:hypothetical protein